MNNTKDLIRLYESYTHKVAHTLNEKFQQEKSWIKLHKQMIQVSKKLGKKRKNELTPFIKKTLDYAKKQSKQIYNELLEKKDYTFNTLLDDYENVYFASGVKGLIEVYLKKTKKSITLQELVSSYEAKEKRKNTTTEEWLRSIEKAKSLTYHNKEDAFEAELYLCELMKVYGTKSNQTFKKKYKQEYGILCDLLNKVQNYLLEMLNYNIKLEELFPTKTHRHHLRRNGLLETIQTMEEKGEANLLSPISKELLEHIHLCHPLDEFPHILKMKRKFVIHVGPTNSGKTYRAIEALKQAKTGVYLAPIRLLALEIQEKLCRSGVPCHLVTGEGDIRVEGAKHRSSTIEMAPFDQKVDVAVIDEMQMIEDPKRGFAWVKAIFGIQANEIHLCGSAHALDFIQQLIAESGDDCEIHTYERQTPLIVEEKEFSYPHTIENGDALIVFSKTRVLEVANELKQLGYKVSMIYGRLPAETRRKQVELFSKGETQVLVSTDAIGIGLNLPIKRVVFLDTEKFDGKEKRPLSTQEIKQISGRAGRKGRYEVGFVNSVSDKERIKQELKRVETPIKKSVVLPPESLVYLNIGTLRQRLFAWQHAPLDVPYLEKADISEQMNLLRDVERWEYNIPVDLIFKALYIPFDSSDRELTLLWMEYVRQLKEGHTRLTKPKFQGNSLNRLEMYYQQINLYYNFSRKFKLKMDIHWIKEQKQKTSYSINSTIRRTKRQAG